MERRHQRENDFITMLASTPITIVLDGEPARFSHKRSGLSFVEIPCKIPG